MRKVRLVLMLAGLVLAQMALVGSAQAVTISLDSIVGAPGSNFTPNDRLGLISSKVGDVAVPHIINIADCEAIRAALTPKIRITWSWIDKPALVTTPVYGIKIAAPGASCDGNNMTEPATTTSGCKILTQDHSFANSFTANGETIDIDLNDLLGSTSCLQNSDTDAKIYFIVNTTGVTGTGTSTTGIALSLRIGLARPAAPTIDSISAGEQNLKVAWTHVDTSGNLKARVYWDSAAFAAGDPGSAAHHSSDLTGTSYQITGLTDNTEYNVTVVAIDADGNESPGAPIHKATPIPVQDFWQYYKANGGAEKGDFAPCSSTRTGHFGVLGVILAGLALVLLRRKRAFLLTIVLLSAFAVPAFADSPQTASIDLRIGSYLPKVDREFENTNHATPYKTVLDDGAWDFGATVDWRVWHGFGELAFGIGGGRWKQEGHSLSLTGSKTDDTTSLSIVPISVDAVYRFDVLADRWNFPIVPYAKVGGVYAIWWVENGLGNLAKYTVNGNTTTARGATGGFHATAGVRLLLDVFEPQAARSFDIELGVNHSYLFAEYRKLILTDFGNKDSIDLSDDIWAFGLAFDL